MAISDSTCSHWREKKNIWAATPENMSSKVFNQVWHKHTGCTSTEDGYRLDISDLWSRGIVLCSKNKGADQLCGYHTADLRLCFCIYQSQVFSWCGSYMRTERLPIQDSDQLSNICQVWSVFTVCSLGSYMYIVWLRSKAFFKPKTLLLWLYSMDVYFWVSYLLCMLRTCIL